MSEPDNQAFREWQARRIELKEELAAHPERYAEISRQLENMDLEHQQLLDRSRHYADLDENAAEYAYSAERDDEQGSGDDPDDYADVFGFTPSSGSYRRRRDRAHQLTITVEAGNLEDLQKLFDMAVYEWQKTQEYEPGSNEAMLGFKRTVGENTQGQTRGTMGGYSFNLKVEDDDGLF